MMETVKQKYVLQRFKKMEYGRSKLYLYIRVFSLKHVNKIPYRSFKTQSQLTK